MNWVRKEGYEKNKRQRSWAKSFIWENIKILKDEKGEVERWMGEDKGERR